MGKFKLNKKHLFFFVILLLVFSLNLNSFASLSHSVSLGKTPFLSYYYSEDWDVDIDCTSSTGMSISSVDIDGVVYPCTIFQFPSSSIGYYKGIATTAPLGLYTNTTYNVDFHFKIGSVVSPASATCNVTLFFRKATEPSIIPIAWLNDLDTGTWYHINTNIKIPDLSGDVSCFVAIDFVSSDTSFSAGAGRFIISDFVFTVDDPVINGTPINTPSTEELENTLNEYNEVMDSLPKVDENELSDLMEFDFDSFSDGMSFVRQMFERTMNTFGFNAVLVFGLTVGLATYIIGRKVG